MGGMPIASSARSAQPQPLTVGFDLDMTLIDSRPGIKAAYEALAAETGTEIDTELVVSRLGPPLEVELGNWYPADRVTAVTARYRELYLHHAITGTETMPGAREAVAAVHALGGRVIVVTAKHGRSAELHIEHLGIGADRVIGQLWAEGKAAALREHGAAVYVGDHVGDVRGAHAAGAVSVAVTTGPCDRAELAAAGAHVVLGDLTEFPSWLDSWAQQHTARAGS
jgi:phosphoglycolate phosphatase